MEDSSEPVILSTAEVLVTSTSSFSLTFAKETDESADFVSEKNASIDQLQSEKSSSNVETAVVDHSDPNEPIEEPLDELSSTTTAKRKRPRIEDESEEEEEPAKRIPVAIEESNDMEVNLRTKNLSSGETTGRTTGRISEESHSATVLSDQISEIAVNSELPNNVIIPVLPVNSEISVDESSSENTSDDEASLSLDTFDDSSNEDAPMTVEAKEERLLERYRNLLSRQNILFLSGEKTVNYTDLRKRFESLLQEIPEVLDDSENNRMKALHCAVLKNLSNICQRQKEFANALAYLTQVAELDYTDVVMMHNMGELAIKLGNFPVAANFFQDALAIRETHWPSLDALMTITYALNYLIPCLNCCLSALKMEPSHQRALAFVHKIFHDHKNLKEDFFIAFRQLSDHVTRPLPSAAKRYLDEAMAVKKRWWKPEESGENDPILQQPKVSFPAVTELTFKHVGELLIDTLAELDSNKMWTALMIVSEPDVSPEADFVIENTKLSDPFANMSGVDNSTQSGEDTNKGSLISTASSALPKSKRKIDPVLLEMTEKRRSARNKGTSRNDEVVIREMLNKFIKEVFGDIPETFTSSTAPAAPSVESVPSTKTAETVKTLWSQPLEEAVEVRTYLKSVNELRINRMIRTFLQFFAERTHLKWPPSLVPIFVDLFYHIADEEYLPPYHKYDSTTMEDYTRKTILLVLCAMEFVMDIWMQTGSIGDLPRNFLKHLNFLEVWPHSGEFLSSTDRPMHLRILILLHKWHVLREETDLSKYFLDEVQKRLEDETVVQIPNLKVQNVISQNALAKLTEEAESSSCLSELEALYQQKDFIQVVKLARELLGGEISDQKVGFTETFLAPLHVKMVTSSLDHVNLAEDDFEVIALVELLLRNLLKQVLEMTEATDDEKKKRVDAYRLAIVDLCEILAKITSKKKTGFGRLTLDQLKSWTGMLVELCILLVHKSDGSMRRPSSLATWILLYRVIRAAEKLLPMSTENLGDASLRYLEEVHGYLGGHSWCTVGDGSFLNVAVHRFSLERAARKASSSSENTEISLDDVEYHLEQCFRCLYDVSKCKNRYFQHHKCSQVKLNLGRAIPLYQFFLPEEMPTFDGYKADCISQEGVLLFNKICPMITKSPAVLTREALQTFIQDYDMAIGDLDPLPAGLEKVEISSENPDLVSQNLFYLLADFYFKTADHNRAIRLYTTDLCINPRRLDSWAGLAFSKIVEVEKKLTSFKMKPSQELFDETMEALKYLSVAAKIAHDSEKLHIECGSKLYILHSYLSRQLSQSQQFRLRQAEKVKLREDKKILLQLAQRAFLSAEDCEDSNEAWLSQYMLGKTCEKLEKEKPWIYLAHYASAAECLHFDGARYPSKIAYYKAPGLSVEALEMFYRIFASSLKFLCRSNAIFDSNGFKSVEFYLTKAENSPFASQSEFEKEDSDASESVGSSENFVVKRVVESVILDRLEIDAIPEKDAEIWRLDLISRCVAGLRVCLTRYTEHYKSIYRLARLYYEFRPLRDLQKTRDLLLGPAISWQNCPHMPCAGLFQNRKPTCFFKGIWHIRSEEIQRSLSFATHMYRAVQLLIGVSTELRESLLLLQIHQQLAKPPDADSKKFLRVVDYFYLSSLAMKSALLSVINRVEDYETDACSPDVRVNFLREVLKVYQTARKENLDGKNMELANAMLAQAYLRLVEGVHKTHCPVPTPQAVVDKAIRYIQQVQFRQPKSPQKSVVVINLSTGLQEEPEPPPTPSTDPLSTKKIENNEVVTGTENQTAVESASSTEPASTASGSATQPTTDPIQDEEVDLIGFDLGMNPAGVNFGDFGDLDLDVDDIEMSEEQAPSAEI